MGGPHKKKKIIIIRIHMIPIRYPRKIVKKILTDITPLQECVMTIPTRPFGNLSNLEISWTLENIRMTSQASSQS